MNRRLPLILVADPQQLSSGLMPDKHVLMKPLWEIGVNVTFAQGRVVRQVPAALMFNTGAEPSRGLHQQQQTDGTRVVLTATYEATPRLDIYRWYGPAPTLIGSIAGANKDHSMTAQATFADFVTWGNWTLVNNGLAAPRLYDPVGPTFNVLANAPTPVAFVKKANQLLAVGVGLTKKGVSWSDADDITNWAPAPDALAGSLTIEELDTPIRAVSRLGQHIAAYAEDQLGIVSFLGAPFHFGQRVALDGIGAVGKMAVASDGRLNYGVSRNGIWRTDGQEYGYIDEGVLDKYLQENVNWDQASKIVAARNDVTRCFEFHFPMGANLENSEGWSFDPATGGWGQVSAFQSAMERRLFDKPLAAINGAIVLLDDNPAWPAALDLRTKPMLIMSEQGEALHASSRMDEVEIAAKSAVGVEWRYCTAEDIDGPRSELEWQTLQTDLRTYKLEPSPTGTYHWLEFRSVIDNWELDLQGFALFGIPDGGKRDTL